MVLRQRALPHSRDDVAAEIYAALNLAGACLRWRKALHLVGTTFAVPVLLAAGWVALVRFTLLELPALPALLVFGVWLAGCAIRMAFYRVTPGNCARYLDRALGLDERVSTWLELERKARTSRTPYAQSFAGRQLLPDTIQKLRERGAMLPGRFHLKLRWQYALASLAALVILVLCVTLPTPLDEVRAERAALRQEVHAQLERIAALRQQLLVQPGLSEQARAALLAELDALQQQLGASDLDREALVALVADAQERIRSLSTASPADFNPLVSVARLIQAAAVNNSNWDPLTSQATTELGKGAEAALSLSEYVPRLGDAPREEVAQTMERAASLSGNHFATLGEDLNSTATSLRGQRDDAAADSLRSVARRLREFESEQQAMLAVQNTLALLEESRQSIAQAGLQENRHGQVGFRRGNDPSRVDPAQSQQADPSADGQVAESSDLRAPRTGQDNRQSGLGPLMGQNVPALGGQGSTRPSGLGYAGSSGGGTGTRAGTGGGQSQQGNSTTTTGGARQGTDPNSKGGSGGIMQGQISGPISGANGAISRVQNPAGRGLGGAGQPDPDSAGSPGEDKVYVPNQNTSPGVPAQGSADGSLSGQAAPDPLRTDGLAGRASDGGGSGGGSTDSGKAPGAITPIHTPYTRIIGQYARLATEALDRTYIPSDARQYVKEYFTELGK